MDSFQDYFSVSMQLVGALALLIYGMKVMSEALQKMAGPQLRHVLGAMTTNRFTGMLTGTLVTCAVQSSSATTVMTVSFVNAGLLTLAQAISVVMGANIGTTLTAWIMSLGYNVDLTSVVYPAFFIGIILIYLRRHRYVGDFLFGISFMFLSLVMLSNAGKAMDLAHNQSVVDFFASFDTGSYLTIITFLAVGTLITCIVQSSAAVMAITILLCSTGVLPIYLGIALVMGENIGTTATANLAALGANTQARRAAFAHLMFNVIGVVWVLCVFYPFVDMVCSFVGYDPTHSGQAALLPVVLAMFHTCFNVTNTAALIGFIPQMERLCCAIIKDKPDAEGDKEFRLQYIGNSIMQTPEISVLQAQKETRFFADRVCVLFSAVEKMVDENDNDKLGQMYEHVQKEEDMSDQTELAIARYLEKVSDAHLSDETKEKIRQMMREISELESISDSCFNLARSFNRRQEGMELTPELRSNIRVMMRSTYEALKQMNMLMQSTREDFKSISETERLENEINTLRNKFKAENITNVDERKYTYALGTMYIDIINECEKLGDYVVNVVEARTKQMF